MSTIRRFALAGFLAALFVPFATPAQAGGGYYCFTLNGKEYCLTIPGPLIEWPRPPHFIDPGPLRSIDVSKITTQLSDLTGGKATHLFVTDALGQTAIVIDLKGGVAIDLNQNVVR